MAVSLEIGRGNAANPVSVHMINGRGVTLAVNDGTRSRELKTCLQQEFGFPSSEMELFMGSQVLHNSEIIPVITLPSTQVNTHPSAVSKLSAPPPLQLTLFRTSRIPAFLERKGLESLNSKTYDGSTALHLAVSQGDTQLCLDLLVDIDFVAINDSDFLGNTALHQAADQRLPTVCAAILDHSRFTAVGAANRNGRTALHIAALRGDTTTCASILGHSLCSVTQIEAIDVLGLTAADLAESVGYDELSHTIFSAAKKHHHP